MFGGVNDVEENDVPTVALTLLVREAIIRGLGPAESVNREHSVRKTDSVRSK